MMKAIGTFPFGQPVHILAQEDRTPKRVFVLGVYVSAVHARWVGNDGRQIIQALAVASEPEIFWRGEGSASIIRGISIPDRLGRLEAASRQFNGPSGIALDEFFLAPLSLERSDAWLCDLVPHSCMNPAQQKAIERSYLPLVEQYQLPKVSVPRVPRELSDESRRQAILEEIQESRADVLILLGDQPIRWFLHFHDTRWRRLSDFGSDPQSYGRLHHVTIAASKMRVLPLAHPRQVARLGRSSLAWYHLHQSWLREHAGQLSCC
jgi:uracil-DNA glycosylase